MVISNNKRQKRRAMCPKATPQIISLLTQKFRDLSLINNIYFIFYLIICIMESILSQIENMDLDFNIKNHNVSLKEY